MLSQSQGLRQEAGTIGMLSQNERVSGHKCGRILGLRHRGAKPPSLCVTF